MTVLTDQIRVAMVISSDDLDRYTLAQLAAAVAQLVHVHLRLLLLLAGLVLLATELLAGFQVLLGGVRAPAWPSPINLYLLIVSVLLGRMRGLAL